MRKLTRNTCDRCPKGGISLKCSPFNPVFRFLRVKNFIGKFIYFYFEILQNFRAVQTTISSSEVKVDNPQGFNKDSPEYFSFQGTVDMFQLSPP